MTKKVTEAEQAKAEVDKVHAGIREKWATHLRSEVDFAVATGDGDGEITLRTVDGRLYVTTTDSELVFDRDGVIELRRQLDAAFQAVA